MAMDLGDRKAWDDSDLINTWDEALEEYKKYHSIHMSGKRLEDVLSKEEMAQVIAQRKALRKGTHERPLRRYDEDDDQAETLEPDEKEMSMSPERDIPIEVAISEPEAAPAQHNDVPQQVANGPSASSTLPQMPLMVGVQDEALKNLLMAWYYAGYHTGLHEGRQQAIKEMNGGASKVDIKSAMICLVPKLNLGKELEHLGAIIIHYGIRSALLACCEPTLNTKS